MKFRIFLFIITFSSLAFAETSHWLAKDLILEAKKAGYPIILADRKSGHSVSSRKIISGLKKGTGFRKNAQDLKSFKTGVFEVKKIYSGDTAKLKGRIYVYFKSTPISFSFHSESLPKESIYMPPTLVNGEWLLILVPRPEGNFTILKDVGAFKIVPEIIAGQKGRSLISQAQIEEYLK